MQKAAHALRAALGYRPWRLDHPFQREVFLLSAFGLAAFYVTALATFTPTDASWTTAVFPPQVPQNLAGALGAKLAGIAYFGLGAAAWLAPIPLLVTAILIVSRRPHAAARSRMIGWALVLAASAATATVRLSPLSVHGFELPAGGYVGSAVSALLFQYLGHVGSLIAIATAGACAVLLVLRRSLIEPLWRNATAGFEMPELRLPSFRRAPSTQPEESADAPAVAAAPELPRVAPVPDFFPRVHDEPAIEAGAALEDEVDEPDHVAPAAAFAPFAVTPPAPKKRYNTPSLALFNRTDPNAPSSANPKELEATANFLVKTLLDFGVEGRIVGYQPGPVVTTFEFQTEAGTKQARVLSLIDDIALALKVDSIFIHPVKGKSALGIQVPNTKREAVFFGDVVAAAAFRDTPSPLTFGMGKSISGQPMCADLAAMPHLLAAGATGSGKSVAINALLSSIIMKSSPDDVRMILVDPKMLELSVYEGIPHLLMPVITEPDKASLALKWATHEMERRYRLMQHGAVRNIAGFNDFLEKASPARLAQLAEATGDPQIEKLPYIMLVIDELADLMMTAPKDVESSIQRLAQKARASGIHMVLATQRPSVDIITGVIKANLPCRIAFQVVSKHDSRTILDLIGAEKLLGKGDMLLQRPGIGKLERIQGAFISDEEVINLVAAVKRDYGAARYDEAIMGWIDDELTRQKSSDKGEDLDNDAMEDDPRYGEALNIARTHGVVSASFLQRHLKIGYNRAARIVEFMEKRGLVDKADGAKPRKWLGPVA